VSRSPAASSSTTRRTPPPRRVGTSLRPTTVPTTVAFSGPRRPRSRAGPGGPPSAAARAAARREGEEPHLGELLRRLGPQVDPAPLDRGVEEVVGVGRAAGTRPPGAAVGGAGRTAARTATSRRGRQRRAADAGPAQGRERVAEPRLPVGPAASRRSRRAARGRRRTGRPTGQEPLEAADHHVVVAAGGQLPLERAAQALPELRDGGHAASVRTRRPLGRPRRVRAPHRRDASRGRPSRSPGPRRAVVRCARARRRPRPTFPAARRPWVLAATALAAFGATVMATAVNVVLPTLATRAGRRPFATIQWVVLSYLLATIALVPAIGRLGDLWGKDAAVPGRLRRVRPRLAPVRPRARRGHADRLPHRPGGRVGGPDRARAWRSSPTSTPRGGAAGRSA
jgi:hypothetical protein